MFSNSESASAKLSPIQLYSGWFETFSKGSTNTISEDEVWAAAFRESGNRDVTAEVLPGLNHLFVVDPDGFPGGYAKLPPPIRVDSHVVGIVADWLAQRLK